MKQKFYILTALLLCRLALNAQWTQMDVPHVDNSYIFDMEVPDTNSVWGLSWSAGNINNNEFLRTGDGGTTWALTSLSGALPAGYLPSNLSPIDKDTCYLVAYNSAGTGGVIYKTTDGGATWNQVGLNTFGTGSFPNFVYFWDAQQGIAMGDPNPAGSFEIYLTNDYGNTWTQVPSANIPSVGSGEYGFVNMYSTFGNTIWFTTVFGATNHIYRSHDNGMNWEAFELLDSTTLTPLGTYQDFVFTDSLHGYINGVDVANVPFLWTTNDGGETWNIKTTFTGAFCGYNICAVPGTPTIITSSFYIGVNGTAYSNDYGNTWITIDSGSVYGHSDLKFLNNGFGWSGEYKNLASSFGGIFKWSGTAVSVNNLKSQNIAASVFPNPASETVYVQIADAGTQKIRLTLWDQYGRLVSDNSYNQPGDFFVHAINIKPFVRGVYLLDIQVGSGHYKKKLIIQ